MSGEMDIREYVFWWYLTFKIICIDRLPVRFPYQEESAAGGVQAALLISNDVFRLVLKVKLKLKPWAYVPLTTHPMFSVISASNDKQGTQKWIYRASKAKSKAR